MVAHNQKPATDNSASVQCSWTDKSAFWQVVHILGSLKLALILLAILAIACAVATFTEANFNTKIAQATIYKAPWFVFWLGLLCINLFAVTLTRLPWQRKHMGFIITHYGIISLLIGALIGSTWGFEGNVTLRTGAPPTDRVITNRPVIQVESPADGRVYRMSFDPEVTRPSATRLRHFTVPGSPLTIVASDMSTSLRNEPELIVSTLPGAPAGILLEFSSETVSPDPIRIPLLLDSQNAQNDFFGLAKIQFVPQLPDRSPHIVSEIQIVFAHHPSIIQAAEGSTGWRVELKDSLVTFTDTAHKSQAFPVSKLLGQSVKIGSSTFHLDAYWPDFAMRKGRPISVSPLPKNPAVLVRITAPAQEGARTPLLEIAPHPGDSEHPLQYQLSRGGVVYASGKLAKEGIFSTGWADWKVKLLNFSPSASLATRVIPSPSSVGSEGATGFQAFLQSADGTRGTADWVGPGNVTTLFHRDGFIRLTYGFAIQPLPFTIQLNSFEVPRYEGTTTPSNYISTLTFLDSHRDAYKRAVAKMNHPANFPGNWWAAVTGLNYKFSQAQWNPSDLQETTLQVLYDPGWFFKWAGSFGICTGIAIMFYFTPKRS